MDAGLTPRSIWLGAPAPPANVLASHGEPSTSRGARQRRNWRMSARIAGEIPGTRTRLRAERLYVAAFVIVLVLGVVIAVRRALP